MAGVLQKTNMKLEHGPLEEEMFFSETIVFRFRVPLNDPICWINPQMDNLY